jgi:hypothetical protein
VSDADKGIVSSPVLAARPGRLPIEEIARTIAISTATIVGSLRMSTVLQMKKL